MGMYNKGSNDYASRGVAGAGLGLGIAGTALGLLNGGLSGLGGGVGGLFGGGQVGGLASGATAAYIASKDAEIAQYKAIAESNSALRDTYDRVQLDIQGAVGAQEKTMYALYQPLANEVVNLRQKEAVNSEKLAAMERESVLKEKITKLEMDKAICAATAPLKEAVQYLDCQLKAETSARKCADSAMVAYMNNTFYAKRVTDVAVGTTSTPMLLQNPLAALNCGGCGCLPQQVVVAPPAATQGEAA